MENSLSLVEVDIVSDHNCLLFLIFNIPTCNRYIREGQYSICIRANSVEEKLIHNLPVCLSFLTMKFDYCSTGNCLIDLPS
ncbi:hypothetical protein K2173_000468 [Erythroxylum novogranatense]|uniref:Uncharacterized protein n=1 Tax=Erythroxylum novogranatense TaxID=1862640 RepID=A0AAV8SWI6_9ROSI|nr:hypothetical protein K2173_000468 [Erythroxylum novogranatense]